jgi:hypothetical protein
MRSFLRFANEHTILWYALCASTGLLARYAMVHGDMSLFFSFPF